ncbi:hypothetical protein R3P38DRAFT_1791353 [Favolaschia claudopus]|uniref:Uncharacterized protein n=1 Tax=Favolaschia claudopus TaxID=2862362 RepID=A0AAW0A6W3_9AGAR
MDFPATPPPKEMHPTTRTAFPASHALFTAVVESLRAPEGYALTQIYNAVLTTVASNLRHTGNLSPDETKLLTETLMSPAAKFEQWIARKLVVCVTTALEAARDDTVQTVQWGATNWLGERNPRYYGEKIPALNGGLAQQFEEASLHPTDFRPFVRARLGTLLMIAFLRELCHAWLREVFEPALCQNPIWHTSFVDDSKTLESLLLGGDIKISFAEGFADNPKRFLYIAHIFQKPHTMARSYAPINVEEMQRLFDLISLGPVNLADAFAALIPPPEQNGAV